MNEANVELMENGPALIKGPLTYVNADGVEEKLEKPWIGICRCGHSAKKPFCDGAHKAQGFEAAKGEMRS